MKTIRVLLVDDHALVRAGICALLQSIGKIEVVDEAEDGREALRLIEKHQPDIVLLDLSMPGLNGLEIVERVTKDFPHVQVIILSMHSSEEYVLQALRAGAKGYLLKGARIPELEIAITSVAAGDTYLSPAASKHLVSNHVQRARELSSHAHAQTLPYKRLTPRQREILQLIAEGKTTKEIAGTLNISGKTVEMHRSQLMERLDIHDVPGLVRYAIRNGFITSE